MIEQTKMIKRIPEGYFQEGNGTAQLEELTLKLKNLGRDSSQIDEYIMI